MMEGFLKFFTYLIALQSISIARKTRLIQQLPFEPIFSAFQYQNSITQEFFAPVKRRNAVFSNVIRQKRICYSIPTRVWIA